MENDSFDSIRRQLEKNQNPTDPNSKKEKTGLKMSNMVMHRVVKSRIKSGIRSIDEDAEPSTDE